MAKKQKPKPKKRTGKKNQSMKTEVVPKKKKRRILTVDYKLRILKEIDACADEIEVGAVLRREKLYSAQVKAWRKLQEEKEVNANVEKKRGPKPSENSEVLEELRRLQKENKKLQERLLKAETIIAVQKKISIQLEFPPFQDSSDKY